MSHEFACHSKACAPPPAGKGGSDAGSGGFPANRKRGTPDMVGTTQRVHVVSVKRPFGEASIRSMKVHTINEDGSVRGAFKYAGMMHQDARAFVAQG